MGGFLSFREEEDSKEVKDLLDLLDQLYVLAQILFKRGSVASVEYFRTGCDQ